MDINFNAPINTLSYGYVGYNILKALDKNHKVALFPIGQIELDEFLADEQRALLTKCMKNAQFFNPAAPSIRLYHQFDMALSPGYGKRFGFSIFELDELTEIEKHQLCSVEENFVCSQWARQVLRKELQEHENTYSKHGFTRDMLSHIHVVPLGVDHSVFSPNRSVSSTTRFLMTGKWEYRKAHAEIVDIFNSAFTEDDDVELWVMCDNPFIKREEMDGIYNEIVNSKLGSKVKFLPRMKSQYQIAKIYNSVDCLVSPSRAEGFNLPILECMACGTHVITSNYSAHTEYCTPTNSMLIEFDEFEVPNAPPWFTQNIGHWGKYNKHVRSQIRSYMHAIHNLKQANKLGLNEGGIETATKLSWDNTASKMVEHL